MWHETHQNLFAAILLFCSVAVSAQKGWIQLFNGKDIKDWTIKIKDHPLNENYGNTFSVRDSLLTVNYDQYNNAFKEQFGHIYFNKKFSSYLLVIEYRFTGEQIKDGPGWAIRNSGAMLHCQDPKTIALDQDFPISLEMQLLGGNGKDARTTCNLCTPGTNVFINDKLFTPHCINSVSNTFHGQQWVQVSALVLGDSVIKHMVGKDTVITYNKPQYDGKDKWVQQAGFKDGGLIKEGYISLQSESHPVEFKTVKLFDLSPYMNDPKKLQKILAELQQRKEY